MIRRLIFLVLLCAAAAWAQGSCDLNQGLKCAGNFQEYTYNNLALGGTSCGPLTMSGTSGPYAYTFVGTYDDFSQDNSTTPPTIYWQNYPAPNSPQYPTATGTCYLPCNDPVWPDLPPNCPSPTSSESKPFVQWSPDIYNSAGGLLGSTPELYDGATYCFRRSIIKLMEIYTQCTAVRGSLHAGQVMQGPNHCFDNVITLTPPTCYCGAAPTCQGNDTTSAQWVCPTDVGSETLSYEAQGTCPGGDPTCTCDYYVTDHYDCNGNFVYETLALIDEQCSPPIV